MDFGFIFETKLHCVAKAGLKFDSFLLLFPEGRKCWYASGYFQVVHIYIFQTVLYAVYLFVILQWTLINLCILGGVLQDINLVNLVEQI